ncbi:MAG: acetate--CoA ligase family protein [Candidatus Geothermincolia bacterium]
MISDFTEIDSIINARSMAIVGASNSPTKFGYMFTRSQVAMGFDGPLYLVNPNEDEIMGRPAYPDIPSLPQVPDLVYLTIPAHRSMDVLRDCASTGVKAVIIMASGFREAGEKGRELEDEALRIAREGGFRMIGPNCFGIYNPRNGLTLLPGYDFSGNAGDVAFISQSGGFSAHVARQGKSVGVDFSAVVSFGNAADLDETDFLEYFARDGATGIITAYLEGAKGGERFAEILRSAAASKPVIIWKVGRSESSRRAVVSHTGSLAGSPTLWDALVRQSGAIEANGVDELLDIVVALKHMGRHPGKRLLVCGGGGGLGTYGADLAEKIGLLVPDLDPATFSRMQETLDRAGAVAGNPLDIGSPLIPAPFLEAALKEAALNETTDVLVFDLAVNFGHDIAGDFGIARAQEILIDVRKVSGKPLAAVLYTRSFDVDDMRFETMVRRMRRRLQAAGIPVFPTMERAMKAIAAIN